MVSENKILLALQFWKGDKFQAARLADFLADLEPGKNEEADFLFVSRFDCPQDIGLVKRVSRKFNTYHTVSRRRGTGWPVGCNELWLATMEWITQLRAVGKIPAYKAVFTFEADNVPLMRGWVNHFSHHWDKEYARRGGKLSAMGFLHPMGPHINGNAMFSLDPAMTKPMLDMAGRCPPRQGWDFFIAPKLKELGWAEMPGLLSVWNTPTVSEDAARGMLMDEIRWVHGVKDSSLFDFAQRLLL